MKKFKKVVALFMAMALMLGALPGMTKDANIAYASEEESTGRAIEDTGGVIARDGAQLIEDDDYGNILEIHTAWISGGASPSKGGGSIVDAAELMKKEAFTLYMDLKINEPDNNMSDKSAILIGTSANYIRIVPRTADGKGFLKYQDGSGEKAAELSSPVSAGEWNSIAIVYEEDNGNGQAAVYLNGEQVLGKTDVGFKLSGLVGLEASLGCTYATGFLRTGKYDNLVISSQADSDEMVKAETAERAATKNGTTVETPKLQKVAGIIGGSGTQTGGTSQRNSQTRQS